jgi:hypothetical protein
MEILAIGFLAIVIAIGFAPKEATQVALVGAWVVMGVSAVGAVLWSLIRILLN